MPEKFFRHYRKNLRILLIEYPAFIKQHSVHAFGVNPFLKLFQELRSVFRPVCAILLKLNNIVTNYSVADGQQLIYGSLSGSACNIMYIADILDQPVE